METLWVVMPAYNEATALPSVVREWMHTLHVTVPSCTFCIIDDGSTDETGTILDALGREFPALRVVHQKNRGHGQTCVEGYRRAIDAKADWILQIDSDGQCDPASLEQFWTKRSTAPVLYGYRASRDDGKRRMLISRVVSVVALLGAGTWVRDPNVPYRLMRRDALAPLLPLIPPDFHLANILVAVLHEKMFGIRWIPIHFRSRIGGVQKTKSFGFAKRGWQLFRQLRDWKGRYERNERRWHEAARL